MRGKLTPGQGPISLGPGPKPVAGPRQGRRPAFPGAVGAPAISMARERRARGERGPGCQSALEATRLNVGRGVSWFVQPVVRSSMSTGNPPQKKDKNNEKHTKHTKHIHTQKRRKKNGARARGTFPFEVPSWCGESSSRCLIMFDCPEGSKPWPIRRGVAHFVCVVYLASF